MTLRTFLKSAVAQENQLPKTITIGATVIFFTTLLSTLLGILAMTRAVEVAITVMAIFMSLVCVFHLFVEYQSWQDKSSQ